MGGVLLMDDVVGVDDVIDVLSRCALEALQPWRSSKANGGKTWTSASK